MGNYMPRNKYVRLSASGVVIGGKGILSGMYVASTVGGTVKFFDHATSADGSVIFNTITPAIGYHNLGEIHCTDGCYAARGVSSTLDITLFVREAD